MKPCLESSSCLPLESSLCHFACTHQAQQGISADLQTTLTLLLCLEENIPIWKVILKECSVTQVKGQQHARRSTWGISEALHLIFLFLQNRTKAFITTKRQSTKITTPPTVYGEAVSCLFEWELEAIALVEKFFLEREKCTSIAPSSC